MAVETSGSGEFEVMPRAEGEALVLIIPVGTARPSMTLDLGHRKQKTNPGV